MLEPFGRLRINSVVKLIQSSDPNQKVILDLGAGKPAVSDMVKCYKRTKVDNRPEVAPDIVHDITQGIPLPDN